MKVSVSVLNNYDRLINTVKQLSKTSCDFIHIDVMDGVFVEDKKFPLEVVKDVKSVSLKPLDVHLMVSDLDTVRKYALLRPEYLTFHVEILKNKDIINYVKSLGVKVGLAINKETDVTKLFPYLLDIDLILVMSVKPGNGGQKFDKEVLKKVRILKEKVSDKAIISIDGGVNGDNVKFCKDAGCDMVVSGSFVVNADDYERNIQILK